MIINELGVSASVKVDKQYYLIARRVLKKEAKSLSSDTLQYMVNCSVSDKEINEVTDTASFRFFCKGYFVDNNNCWVDYETGIMPDELPAEMIPKGISYALKRMGVPFVLKARCNTSGKARPYKSSFDGRTANIPEA